MGHRHPDAAKMAMIELVGNPIDVWEQRQEEQAAAELDKPNYWQWELKLLQQEQIYFKQQLDNLQTKIEDEIDAQLSGSLGSIKQDKEGDPAEIRSEVEQKYQKDKKFLLNSLKRAIMDEEIHMREEHMAKYKNLDRHHGQSDDFDIRPMIQAHRNVV